MVINRAAIGMIAEKAEMWAFGSWLSVDRTCDVIGTASSSSNLPVLAARISARRIAAKSLPVSAFNKTKRIIIRQ